MHSLIERGEGRSNCGHRRPDLLRGMIAREEKPQACRVFLDGRIDDRLHVDPKLPQPCRTGDSAGRVADDYGNDGRSAAAAGIQSRRTRQFQKLRGARLQPSDPFRLAPELPHCRERCGRARRRRADAEDEAGGGIFR
jgi:hypothetical protein